MWVIVAYKNSRIIIYEFDTEEEARERITSIKGYKILSEVIYFNDPNVAVVKK